MRLSREKIVHLSHVMADYLDNNKNIKLNAPRNDIRLLMVNIITKELKKDEAIDREVRKKISSMKSEVPEGSAEWDALYYKYYQEAEERT